MAKTKQKAHPAFKVPDNLNIKIWRYLDFTKFVSLLETESLFFCRADCFDDPFEGSFPQANKKLQDKELKKATPEEQEAWERWVQGRKEDRKRIMINCWHMNDYESAAMWNLYANSNEAVCIQSTYKRLRVGISPEIYIGEVQYIDYRTQPIYITNLFYPYMHKRRFFEHEKELRAVIWKPRSREEPPAGGELVKVNLNRLIERIYVAPTSPTWFYNLVQKIVAKYSLNKKIVRSSLDEEPYY